jgi:hypothetical protein
MIQADHLLGNRSLAFGVPAERKPSVIRLGSAAATEDKGVTGKICSENAEPEYAGNHVPDDPGYIGEDLSGVFFLIRGVAD